MKAQGRADACGMFTELSGPLLAIPATRSGWGHVRVGAAEGTGPVVETAGLRSPPLCHDLLQPPLGCLHPCVRATGWEVAHWCSRLLVLPSTRRSPVGRQG